MSRQVSRRAVVAALATGSMMLTAGTTGVAGSSRRPISGQFHQHGFDGGNTASTPHRRMHLPLRTFWRTPLDSVSSTPLVTDEHVLALGFGVRGSRIHALDREDGEHRWSVDLGEWTVSNMLAVTDEYALTATVGDPRVTALSLSDGDIAWETTVDDATGFRVTPRVSDGTLYLADSGSGVVALDVDSGSVEQTFPGRYTRIAVDGDTLYGSRGSPRHDDHGLTVFDGDPEDSVEYSTDGRPGQPTVGDELVFVGTSNEQVHAIEKDSGERRWSVPVEDWATLLTLAGDVVIARADEQLVALETDDGSERWRIEAGASRPVAGADVVYVGREAGVDVYELDSGEKHQSYRDSDIDGPLRSLSVINNALYGAVPRDSVVMVTEDLGSISF